MKKRYCNCSNNSTKETAFPPMVNYFNRLKAFIEQDPTIECSLDYDNKIITIDIEDCDKAIAWRKILPAFKTLGDTTFTIDIKVVNNSVVDIETLETALTGNKAFSRMEVITYPVERDFCIFEPDIIQFSNDNFASPDSLETRTAESLAMEILEVPGLFICSEKV